MIRVEQIPDEVFYAFQKAWANRDTLSTKECLAAAISAWPGSCNVACTLADLLLLPLPQGAAAPLEPRDDGNYDYAGGL
jgi:hypothetical protein